MYSKKLFFNSPKSQTENKKIGTFKVFPHPAIIFSGPSLSLGMPVAP